MTSEAAAVADVAIVGGGFSGTMAAAQLARRGLSSVLIEGGGRLARGIAYSTAEAVHVLNVRAEVMSAWPEDLEDFARQIEAEGGTPKDFVERRRFGRYLGEQLGRAGDLVRPIKATAVSASRVGRGWTVGLQGGGEIHAKALILAIGNQPPGPFPGAAKLSAQAYVANPWGERARAAVGALSRSDKRVLVLGTGLTAVDLVLSLDAAGHRGPIMALSRRGQMPRGHVAYEPAPVERGDVPMGNVLKLWRWLRRRAAQGNWRAAVDAMRPHSSAIWQSFGQGEQDRFLRHVAPWWGSHRHRIAPQVAERMKQLIGLGQLQVVAGRILSMAETPEAVEVEIRSRGRSEGTTKHFDMVFNCTGPLGEIEQTQNPILRQMLNDRLIAPDQIGYGVAVDERNRAGERLWAMGPMTKGRYWEIIAVPDIRGQAAAVAADIEAELTE